MPWTETAPAPQNVKDPRHLAALEWFQNQAGKEVAWPEPLDGMYLVNKAKGIHKPADLSHALSVRQSLEGPYTDAIRVTPSGWVLDYNQEGSDPNYFTNRALQECMKDAVPVGVVIQVKPKPNPRYKVLGLGAVTSFKDGRFAIRQYESSIESAIDVVAFSPDFDATSLDDARKKELRSIAIRRGQPGFRNELIEAYNGRCAVTGCPLQPILEAAHILPYRGEKTNHVQNGLLLRADIHALFDLGLLSIDSNNLTIITSPDLQGTDYQNLSGKEILLPTSKAQWPSREALEARAKLFDIE